MKLTYKGEKTQYEVSVQAIKINVLEVDGNLPMKEKGFILTDEDGVEYDYTAYKTLYRAITGGYQFSNNGEVWDEPTRTITVSILWRDADDAEGYRPESVPVVVRDGETIIDEILLSDENEWMNQYPDVPESHDYSVEADDIVNYNLEISGTTVTYSLEAPLEPTMEEMMSELMDYCIDLDERVSAREEG